MAPPRLVKRMQPKPSADSASPFLGLVLYCMVPPPIFFYHYRGMSWKKQWLHEML
jgi:hypothetical protein